MEHQRLNSQQFDQFRDFIYRKSGICIDPRKVTLLSNRIRRRLRAGDFEDFDVYYRFLTSPQGANELGGFLAAVTTNETFFFRTGKQFEWLTGDWLTEQIASHRAGHREPKLRILSAGCANGAEPYSIAMCLAENAYRLGNWDLKVVGIDISRDMLQHAKDGIFKSHAIEEVSDKQRRKFFSQTEDDHWQVRQRIREMVEFRPHNLMNPLSDEPFDCILIRNVLIYFDAKSKQVVLKNLCQALARGGHLVLGPSEGVYEMLGDLQRISPLVYRKADVDPMSAIRSGGKGAPA